MGIFTALWSKLSGFAAIVGALLVALGAAWLKGRSEGKSATEAEQARHRAEAITRKRKLDHEVDSLAPADLDHRAQRWVRKDNQ